MRHTLNVIIWIVTLCGVSCDRDSAQQPKVTLPELHRLSGSLDAKGDLAGFSTDKEWAFTWPHDEIPLWIPGGMRPTSGPFDDTVPNDGQTAKNWDDPVIITSDRGTELRVWCAREFDRVKHPDVAASIEKWHDWSKLQFYGVGKWADVAVAAPGTATVAESNHLYFVFRMLDRLFRIEATGKDPVQTFQDGLNYVDAIYKFRTRAARRAATQPRDEPPGRVLVDVQ